MGVLFTTAQAAERLGLKPSTLIAWRHFGRGPVYRRVGGRVRYAEDDLQEFLRGCAVVPEPWATAVQ